MSSSAGSNAADNTPRKRAKHRNSRVRFAPAALIGGVAASAVIALSMSGSLAGFVATITNNNNTASTGTLTLSETQGATTCYSNTTATGSTATNSVNCAINKFNGSTTIVPGAAGAVTATVTMKNTGTAPASSFTLTPGTCSQPAAATGTTTGGATDACAKFNLLVTTGATTVANGTLSTLATNGAITLPTLAAGASASYTFTLSLPSQGNTTDNQYQNVTVNQNLIWQLTS